MTSNQLPRRSRPLDGLTSHERELVLWAIDRAINHGPPAEAATESLPILRSAWDKIANPSMRIARDPEAV